MLHHLVEKGITVSDDKVVELASVRPKRLDKEYRKTKYRLEFLVPTSQWKWTVTFVHTTTYSDVAPTLVAAQRAAEKHIDRSINLRGK
jgi:hypothetical protein